MGTDTTKLTGTGIMCTASWLLEEKGYQVFFNRDEQRGRAKALPPAQFTAHNGVRFIMPLDPVGRGSWIAVNEFGLTLCLLNYYQGELPHGELISRGQLIKKFACYSCSETLLTELNALSLKHYAPFTLVIFDSQLCRSQGKVKTLQWNGKARLYIEPLPPLISSAVDADNVIASRQRLFTGLNAAEESVASRLSFHHSHAPEKGHLSPCMHREEAHTVSFTHVKVAKESVTIHYQDGAPCLEKPYYKNELPKVG